MIDINKIDPQQAKLILLGEMFENIIHQFKQPLNAISTESTGIKFQHEMEMISDEELYQALDNITNRVKYLSNTIDDFKDFLKEDKHKVNFNVLDNINKVESILKPILKAKGIEIYKTYNNANIELEGYERELSQVFLNIINNAKDAIISFNPDKKLILIDINEDEKNIIIDIYDNANGIEETILPNIFNNHFTTKELSGGTGIGLNISKVIVEKHFYGTLLATNTKFNLNQNSYYGAKFTIKLPKYKK